MVIFHSFLGQFTRPGTPQESIPKRGKTIHRDFVGFFFSILLGIFFFGVAKKKLSPGLNKDHEKQ